jgi:hypothetical protein
MKRFTETNKWADPWFRRLSYQAKLLWFYLVDHCDNIGLVEIDFTLVSSDVGTKVSADHLKEFGDRIQVLDDGKIFLPKFLTFQYGTLSENCIPHKKIIEAIRFHSLTQTFKGYSYPTARVGSTLPSRVKEKEEEEEKEEDRKKKRRARGNLEEVSELCKEIGLFPRDVEYLWNKWEGNGWQNAGKAMKDWRATVRAWKAQGYLPSQKTPSANDSWPVPPREEEPEEESMMDRLMRNREKKEAERRQAEGEAPELLPPEAGQW